MYDIIVEMPGGSKGFIGYQDFGKARDHYKKINGNYLHKKLVVAESNEVISAYQNPIYFVCDLRKERQGFIGWVHRNIGIVRLMRAAVHIKRFCIGFNARLAWHR